MSFQPGANLYTQGFGSRPENVEVPHTDVRPPATSDTNYPIGKEWVDTIGNAAYILTSLSSVGGALSAMWIPMGNAMAGPIDTINTFGPIASNFNILGTAGQVSISSMLGSATISLTGPFAPTTFTAHTVLLGEGAGSIGTAGPGTDGQVLTGHTGADPQFNAIGTLSGLTAHGVVLAQGAGAFTATAVGVAGQVLTSNGPGLDPTFQAGGGLIFTATTVGAATVLLATQPVPANKAAIVKVTAVGYDNTADLMTSIYSVAGIRNVGGVITIVDNAPSTNNDLKVREDSAISDTDIKYTAGAGGYIVNVVGTANGGGADNITWSIKIEQTNSP